MLTVFIVFIYGYLSVIYFAYFSYAISGQEKLLTFPTKGAECYLITMRIEMQLCNEHPNDLKIVTSN